MKTYLLSAAGVIFLSVIVTLLVPEGKLHKTITFVMRLICIFVLIQPLTQIFNIVSESGGDTLADYELVSAVYGKQQSKALEELLAERYGLSFDCTVSIIYDEGEFRAESVEVVIDKNSENIIAELYEYLGGLGYINITVLYATGT